jgi:flagellar hook assembly protein FlgD
MLSRTNDRVVWQKSLELQPESQVTAIDTDHWGNVYLTDRSYREIQKVDAGLTPITVLRGRDNAIMDPINFHIVFGEVASEKTGQRFWGGYDQAVSVEKWGENSGAERFQLGIGLENYRVRISRDLDRLEVFSSTTDQGEISLAVIDANSNSVVRQIPLGWVNPGEQQFIWDRRDDRGRQIEPGYYRLQVTAKSSYGKISTSKETGRLYLPLYYWEDSGSGASSDRHLIQGARSIAWGTTPEQSIAKHPSEVVYRFADLNTTVDYEIKAEINNKVGDYLKQRITVSGNIDVVEFEAPVGVTTVDWLQLPRESFADGDLEIRIGKVAGTSEAMISQLWLREANYDPVNTPAALASRAQIPEAYSLEQNYPNPFNPTTSIEFGIPGEQARHVTLRIFNMLGQTVKVLVDQQMQPGRHTVVWDASNNFGERVSTGVYFYSITTDNFKQVRKLVLMK